MCVCVFVCPNKWQCRIDTISILLAKTKQNQQTKQNGYACLQNEIWLWWCCRINSAKLSQHSWNNMIKSRANIIIYSFIVKLTHISKNDTPVLFKLGTQVLLLLFNGVESAADRVLQPLLLPGGIGGSEHYHTTPSWYVSTTLFLWLF